MIQGQSEITLHLQPDLGDQQAIPPRTPDVALPPNIPELPPPQKIPELESNERKSFTQFLISIIRGIFLLIEEAQMVYKDLFSGNAPWEKKLAN